MTPGDVCVQRKGRPPSRAIAGNPANYDGFPEQNLMVTPLSPFWIDVLREEEEGWPKDRTGCRGLTLSEDLGSFRAV